MTDTTIETPGQGGEKIQQVEFEDLYTGLHEVREISQLQKKLELTLGEHLEEIPLLASFGAYIKQYGKQRIWCLGDERDVKAIVEKYSFMLPFISKLSISEGWSNCYYYCLHFKLSQQENFFEIKKCFEKNNDYIFISNTGYVFIVNKEDFNSNGYMAQSLRLMSEAQTLGQGVSDISDDDGTVKYYLNGNLEGTLKGSCFTYVSKSNDEDVAYVGHGSCVYKSTLKIEQDSQTGKQILCHNDGKEIDLELGEIKKLTLDPKQNFLFILSEDNDGNTNLHILEHKKIFNEGESVKHEIKTIEGVSDIIVMTNGDLVLTNFDGTTDIISTNLNSLDSDAEGSFEMKRIAREKATDQTSKKILESLGKGIVVSDSAEVSHEGEENEIKITEMIRGATIDGGSKTLKELLDEANSIEEVQKVIELFNKIVDQNSQLKGMPDLLGKIKRKIFEKKNKIVQELIKSELLEIRQKLLEDDTKTLLDLKDKIKTIKKLRKNMEIESGGLKKEIDNDITETEKAINRAIQESQESNKEERLQKIDENILKIKEELETYHYAVSVDKIRKTELWQDTQKIIELLDTSTKSEYEKKMDDLIKDRIKQIKETSAREKEEAAKKINELKNSIKSKIDTLKEIFDEVDDIEAIEDLWSSNELVLRINEKVKELPNEDGDKLLLQLGKVLDDRMLELKIGSYEAVGTVHKFSELGIDTSLYYNEDCSEQVEWDIEGKELPNGKIGLILKLLNGETHEYDKNFALKNRKAAGVRIKGKGINYDMTEDEFYEYQSLVYEWKDENKRQEYYDLLKELRRLPTTGKDKELGEEKQKVLDKIKAMREKFGDVIYAEHLVARLIKQQKLNPRSLVPSKKDVSDYIVLDEEKEILKTVTSRLRYQRRYGGIDILEGGPGLGKTVMCQFLANVTNRELVVVACGRIDPETMFYGPSVTDKGTVWEASDRVKLMQKPGTLVVFDEIDKMPPSAMAKLHSLFDSRRSVYHEKIGNVKANPDCIFMGTRNLYDTLTPPIASRARIFRMNYPSKLNEAYKVSKYLNNPIFNMMKYEEFVSLYDKYIVRQEPEPKNEKEKNIYQEIKNIDKLMQIFSGLRELYSEDSSFKYEVSYRDAQHVYQDYTNGTDFKTAVMNALLRGAGATTDGDKEEKQEQIDNVKRIIDSVL